MWKHHYKKNKDLIQSIIFSSGNSQRFTGSYINHEGDGGEGKKHKKNMHVYNYSKLESFYLAYFNHNDTDFC